MPLLVGRTGIHGSMIGGIANTQAVIDLCAARGIVPEHSIVGPEEVGAVYEKLERANDAGLRYVLDCSRLTPALADSFTPTSPNFAPAKL